MRMLESSRHRGDSTRFSRSKLIILSVLAALASGGKCDDFNVTYKNETPRRITKIQVTVKIEGAGTTFPSVQEWHEGRAPQPNPPDALGGGYFKLVWNVSIQPGESYHVGATFVEEQEIKNCGEVFWDEHGTPFSGGDLSMTYTTDDPEQGLVLETFNSDESPGPITVEQLHWAVTNERIPLEELSWGTPQVESLSWNSVTEDVPFVLVVGESREFDLPDQAFLDNDYVVVRSSVSTIPNDIGQDAVFQLQIRGRIPTASQWGLLIMTLLLLTAGTVMLRRLQRRRRVLAA